MDNDLIKLVNKLQDTFINLGTLCSPTAQVRARLKMRVGGELDMPQLAVVSSISMCLLSFTQVIGPRV